MNAILFGMFHLIVSLSLRDSPAARLSVYQIDALDRVLVNDNSMVFTHITVLCVYLCTGKARSTGILQRNV